MKKIYLTSIGCRTNQEEMLGLAAKFRADGVIVTDDISCADIVIVNTCSVTSHTESKTRRYIRSISRDAPNAKILVTGCFAQQHGETLLEYENVGWVVGNGDKHRIAQIIQEESGAYMPSIDTMNDTDRSNDAKKSGKIYNSHTVNHDFWDAVVPDPAEYDRTRFSIKIQEGCDFKCSYCIVPSLRGASRSAPKDKLIDIFKAAVDKGYKEIVLTGTHIGQYRNDNDKYNLESLINDFLKTGGDYRIRLSSLDPRDLTDSLISVVGGNDRVCDHLHISVQSLCADVLERMGRPCNDLDALVSRLRGFRERYPHAGLGGDFIVGHPGETGAMFLETVSAAEAIGFTYGHVFRFSARRGTASALMGDRVAEEVKKSRSEKLREVLKKNHEKFLSKLAGTELYIIIENEKPARGVGGNYIKAMIPGARAPKNTFARVVLTGEVSGGYCVGTFG